MKTTEDYPQEVGFFSKLDNLPIPFGDYILESLISNGNAIVFKARQKDPERLVALKIPKFGILNSKSSRDQFRTEYAFAAGVRHSAIVPVLEVGQWEGIPYYTMPFIEGHSLLDHVLLTECSLGQKIALYQRICAVVSVLHEDDLIHCDLKSENIMVDGYGEVALLDFGLAHVVSGCVDDMERRFVSGTIRYMSPEQAAGVPPEQLGFQADVFALGVIGFRLFTGVFPFELPENKILALEAVRDCEIDLKPLDTVKIPFSVKTAIKRALSHSIEERVPDATSLLRLVQMNPLKLRVSSLIRRKDAWGLLVVFLLGLLLCIWGGSSLVLLGWCLWICSGMPFKLLISMVL